MNWESLPAAKIIEFLEANGLTVTDVLIQAAKHLYQGDPDKLVITDAVTDMVLGHKFKGKITEFWTPETLYQVSEAMVNKYAAIFGIPNDRDRVISILAAAGGIDIVDRLANLPPDALNSILLLLDHQEVLKWCATSKINSQICDNKVFWYHKSLTDIESDINFSYFEKLLEELHHPYEVYKFLLHNKYVKYAQFRADNGYGSFIVYASKNVTGRQFRNDLRFRSKGMIVEKMAPGVFLILFDEQDDGEYIRNKLSKLMKYWENGFNIAGPYYSADKFDD